MGTVTYVVGMARLVKSHTLIRGARLWGALALATTSLAAQASQPPIDVAQIDVAQIDVAMVVERGDSRGQLLGKQLRAAGMRVRLVDLASCQPKELRSADVVLVVAAARRAARFVSDRPVYRLPMVEGVGVDGVAVDGDENLVTDVTDLWTFARNTRARDPNWMLVETRSPN